MIMRASKRNRAVSIFILCILAFAWTTPAWGRADRVFFGMAGPISEEERATLGGVIAVTHARYAPEAKFETYAKGKASGTAQGAADGFLTAVGQMGHCSGDFCAIAALFWIATAGTVGAVYGAVTGYQDALPAEEAERLERSTKRASREPGLPGENGGAPGPNGSTENGKTHREAGRNGAGTAG